MAAVKKKTPSMSNKVGRPTDYNPKNNARVAELCLAGATDIDIARFLQISVGTIYVWKAKYPEFREAIKRSKELADAVVENALFRKATGYSFESEKLFYDKEAGVVRASIVEHVPPSDTAMIFWLKNRQSKDWRDRVEHVGDPTAPVRFIIEGAPPVKG